MRGGGRGRRKEGRGRRKEGRRKVGVRKEEGGRGRAEGGRLGGWEEVGSEEKEDAWHLPSSSSSESQ